MELLGKVHSAAYIASVDALSRKAKESELKCENGKDATKEDDANKVDIENGSGVKEGNSLQSIISYIISFYVTHAL